MKFSHLKIKTRVSIILGVTYLVASLIVVVLVNYTMKQQALLESESEALMLLDQELAIHTYFTHQLKPKVFALTDRTRPVDFFDPTWMSSTYAVREINKYSKSLARGKYYYKECAIGARSPENEADAYERAWLERFNRDPKLISHSEMRVLEGQPYFVTIRRGEQMESTCLRCHSTPSEAPGGLVAFYGPERSFNRKEGETVSAISIRVPLSQAYRAANRFSLYLSGFLVGVLGILFLIKMGLTRYYIYDPIAQIQHQASLIANSPDHLGETIPLPEGPELRNLTFSFNEMSTQLRQIHNTLENRISERTVALKDLNETLEQENAALQQAREEILLKSEQLRNLANELARTQELERQRLAQDLHDQVCQNLAALALNLDSLKMRAPQESSQQVLAKISNVSVLVEQTYEAAKDLMEGLRPSALVDYGLLTGLRKWAGQFAKRNGIAVDIRGEELTPRLEPQVEMALFRIAQEALTNVAKHAQASQVVVTEEVLNGKVRLTIADNGIGFDPMQQGQPEGRHRWGLMNMIERALAVGGTCSIDSRPGAGTRVIVEVDR